VIAAERASRASKRVSSASKQANGQAILDRHNSTSGDRRNLRKKVFEKQFIADL